MLYDLIPKEAALATLKYKMVGAADAIIFLTNEGYVPNKAKYNILIWTNALIHPYRNIDILSEKQKVKLNILYNKVMRM